MKTHKTTGWISLALTGLLAWTSCGSSSTGSTGSIDSSIDSGMGSCDSALSWIGTRQLGVSSQETLGYSVATDADGNVYVAGLTTGGLDGNTITGGYDYFVTKYDSSGVKQYTRQLGAASESTFGFSVATDSRGNVYVAGYTGGVLDGNPLTGTTGYFFTKYDNNGVKQYTRQLGVAGKGSYGTSITTDAAGNVYVAGYTYGGLDGNTLTGTTDVFVTKYDSVGVKLFTRQFGVASKSTVSVRRRPS